MDSSEGPKTVLLVGFGLSGVGFANTLVPSLPPSHRLVILSSTESAYYPIASLRGSVVPGWEEKVMLPLDGYFGERERHKVLKGYQAIKMEKNKAFVDKELPTALGGGKVIEFEYAVLAMGSSYPTPCHPPPSHTSIPSLTTLLTTLQSDLSKPSVKTVLVAGGGPVGIEFAGEVAHQYPNMRIVLAHHGNALMETCGWKPSLGKSLEDQLKAKGVDVRFGEMVELGGRKTGLMEGDEKLFKLKSGEVEADFLFVAFGMSPYTKLLVDSLSSEFPAEILNEKKQVRVQPTFQLDSPGLDNIFAIGDIVDVDEAKVWVNAQNHGPVAAQNVVSLIKTPEKALKTYSPGSNIIVISCGPDGGAGQVYLGYVMGPWMAAKAKSQTLFYSKFKTAYHA